MVDGSADRGLRLSRQSAMQEELDIDLLRRWLNGEVVRLGARICIFPHGKEHIALMVAEARARSAAPELECEGASTP